MKSGLMIQLIGEMKEEKQQRMGMNDQKRSYRPADKIKGFCGGITFGLRFQEIQNSLVDMGFLRAAYHMIRWRTNYKNEGIPKDEGHLNQVLPIQNPTFDHIDKAITYTWIGHSTAVFSFDGKVNFLIDPVFSDRASPYQWIGPKRFRKPACTIAQLPHINCTLVSHDHYDHLDANSLNELYQRNKDSHFIAGLQSQDAFPKGARLTMLDWTEKSTLEINGMKFEITFVPACHWGLRWIGDKNRRLWGGFVVEEMETHRKVFYSGDTGYCGVFKEIGEAFGGFDLAILPIGAYIPREYLKNQHVNPDEAVQVHKDLKSKKSVGVHWGTFPLGFEHYTAARTDLKEALKSHNLKEDQFVTIQHGGNLVIRDQKEEQIRLVI